MIALKQKRFKKSMECFTTTVDKALMTGYDFVQDVGTGNCQDWQADLGSAQVDCALIGDSWSLDDYKNKQLNASPPFKLQSVNGHANHYLEGAPGYGRSINASEIAGASSDLSGALIYTLGCHSGLNVPSSNTQGALDLAQAFNRKKANYVANTGYGWGLRGGTGLSEKLIRMYTQELVKGAEVSMGEALAAAKQRYYQEDQHFSGYDEKIMEELTFYGLPMYALRTGSTHSAAKTNTFPSVDLTSSLPGSFGDETVVSGTVTIQLKETRSALGVLGASDIMTQVTGTDGS